MRKKQIKNRKLTLFKIWEINSLAVGISAILVLVFFLFYNFNQRIVILEPNQFIRTGEILWGMSAIPYYIKLIKDKKNE